MFQCRKERCDWPTKLSMKPMHWESLMQRRMRVLWNTLMWPLHHELYLRRFTLLTNNRYASKALYYKLSKRKDDGHHDILQFVSMYTCYYWQGLLIFAKRQQTRIRNISKKSSKNLTPLVSTITNSHPFLSFADDDVCFTEAVPIAPECLLFSEEAMEEKSSQKSLCSGS